jgi:hypothetical protein
VTPRRASTAPWVRLDAGFARDAKLRKARATAIWPFVIARMKAGYGYATDDDLDPEILAEESYIPAEICERAVEGLKRVGLLVWAEEDVEVGGRVRTVRRVGGWTTPRWTEYQPDGRVRSDKRLDEPEDEPEAPAEVVVPHAVPGTGDREPNRPRDGMSRDLTGHDLTGQEQQHTDGHTAGVRATPVDSPSRPSAPMRPEDFAADLAPLAEKYLRCYRVRSGRGQPMAISPVAGSRLVALVAQHGAAEVSAALDECGDSDDPLSRLVSRLEMRAQPKRAVTGGPNAARPPNGKGPVSQASINAGWADKLAAVEREKEKSRG